MTRTDVSRNQRSWSALAAALLLIGGWSAEAKAQPGSRRLILVAAGKPGTQEAVKPMLDKVCERAREDALKRLYGEVLNIGPAAELLFVPNAVAPGANKEALTDYVNLIQSAIKSGSIISCLGAHAQVQGEPGQPFDVLIMSVMRDELQRANVLIRQVTSDGTVDGTRERLQVNALGVELSSAKELSGVVGCLAWTFWGIRDWLPDDDCDDWGLPSANVRVPVARRIEIDLTGTRATSRRRLSVALGAAGLSSLAVAGATGLLAWTRYNTLVERCTVVHPCQPADANPKTTSIRRLQVVMLGGAILGTALLGTAGALYLSSGRRGSTTTLSLALDPQAGGLTAVGRW